MSIPSFYFESEESVLKLMSKLFTTTGIHIDLLLEIIFLKSIELNYAKPVLKLIQLNFVDPSIDNNKAFIWACSNNHIEIVKLLLIDIRVDPAVLNNKAIRYASSVGHNEIVKLLLANEKVDPTAINNEAIKSASRYNKLEVVKMLLSDERVNPCASNNEAIYDAIDKGLDDIMNLLLESKKMDLSINGVSIFQKACERGCTKIVELLLAYENLDHEANNNSPFMGAMIYKNMEVLKLLLKSSKINLNNSIDRIVRWFDYNVNNDDIARLIIPYLDMFKVSNSYLNKIETEMKENTEENKMGKVMNLMKDTGINGLIFDETGNMTVFKKSAIITVPVPSQRN